VDVERGLDNRRVAVDVFRRSLANHSDPWLEDHVPGREDEERSDHAHSPGPADEKSGKCVVVPRLDRALGCEADPALVGGADDEGPREQAEPELNPELVEGREVGHQPYAADQHEQ
jgi:hypothetical protein